MASPLRPITCILMCACLLGGIEAFAADRPPGKIYAHWSFDSADGEGETVRDLGPLGLHGALRTDNDKPIERVEGLRGQAVRFPAGHESWVALRKGFGLEAPFTVAVWVKPESRRASMEILGHKAHSWREGSRFVFSLRRMFFEYSDGEQNLEVRNDVHQTKEGQWVFVAVVHDGRHISLHVDGEEIHREPATAAAASLRGAVLGNYVGQKKTYGFIGLMDELVILREAVSSEELVRLGMWALGE